MKLNNVKSLLTGLFVLTLLFVGIGSTTAAAQGRRNGRVVIVRHYNPFWHRHYDPFWSPYYGRVTVSDPIAANRERGYEEGQDQGKKDAKKGQPADPKGQKEYRKSKSLAFREAFLRGYEDGYEDEAGE